MRDNPIKALQDDLNNLRGEREKLDLRIAGAGDTLTKAQQALTDAQRQHAELTASLAPVEQLASELKALGNAIEAQRKATETEVKAAPEFHAALAANLGQQLPKPVRNAIEKTIEGVEAATNELKRAVETSQRELAGAEANVGSTSKHAALAEAAFREGLAQLRQLAGQISAAQRQVANLRGSARAVADRGEFIQAFYEVHQLDSVVKQLRALADPQKEQELTDQLLKHWREWRQAQAELPRKTAEVNKLKQELANKQRELQLREQQREADIKAAMAAVAEQQKPSR